ncbi:MAG: hypothetical protein IT258_12420 [Saprospiraceae bacterium]|nr:hypothetical protein [Saprospiraceae bacterium]
MKIKSQAVIVFFLFLASVIHAQQGRLDSAFGVNGIVLHSFDTSYLSYNAAQQIAVLPDGKFIVGGKHFSSKFLARFEENGDLDLSFGNEGRILIGPGWLASDNIKDMVIQPDGKILVLLESSHFDPDLQEMWDKTYIMRFLPNGDFDENFGRLSSYSDYGVARIETDFEVVQGNCFHLLADGKILVAGSVMAPFSNQRKNFVARCNDDGSLDYSFANEGVAIFSIGGNYEEINQMVVQDDGKIIIGVHTTVSGYRSFGFARLKTDGKLDADFGSDGIVPSQLSPPGNFHLKNLEILPDGAIMAWVNKSFFSSTTIDVVRLKANGSYDTVFGNNGVLTITTDSAVVVSKVLKDDEGNYFLAGYYKPDTIQSGGDPEDFTLTKLNVDFGVVKEFGNSGMTLTDIFNGTNDRVADAVLTKNNKVILAGFASTIYYEAKLTLAQYFGRDTIVTTDTITTPPQDSLILNENGLTILPNPVGEDFQICYPLAEKSIITIDLFNSVGELLYSFLTKEVRAEGQHCEQFTWPKGIIDKGVYFVKVYGRRFAYSGKILKP